MNVLSVRVLEWVLWGFSSHISSLVGFKVRLKQNAHIRMYAIISCIQPKYIVKNRKIYGTHQAKSIYLMLQFFFARDQSKYDKIARGRDQDIRKVKEGAVCGVVKCVKTTKKWWRVCFFFFSASFDYNHFQGCILVCCLYPRSTEKYGLSFLLHKMMFSMCLKQLGYVILAIEIVDEKIIKWATATHSHSKNQSGTERKQE